MQTKNRRAARCLGEYLTFVLALLLAIGLILSGFLFLSGTFPVLLAPVVPVAASTEVMTVIIDAGHGGEDGGANGTVNGRAVNEKDINLSVSLLLRDLLEANGINVVMTRTEDVLLYDRNTDYQGRKKVLDLAARLSIGQSIENAIFVSIHMNAFPQAQYKGLQVYYSPNHENSLSLAQNIQSRVAAQLQTDNKREVKRADSSIHLLEHLKCPAVLVECGFLSNPQECARLADRDYQKKLAFLLFCSISEAVHAQSSADRSAASLHFLTYSSTKAPIGDKISPRPLIFVSKSAIMKAENRTHARKTEDMYHERHENRLYLLGMRNAQSQVAGALSGLWRMEFLC